MGARAPPTSLVELLFPKGEKRAQLTQLNYTTITQSHPEFQGSLFKTLIQYESIQAMESGFIPQDAPYYKAEKKYMADGKALATVLIQLGEFYRGANQPEGRINKEVMHQIMKLLKDYIVLWDYTRMGVRDIRRAVVIKNVLI